MTRNRDSLKRQRSLSRYEQVPLFYGWSRSELRQLDRLVETVRFAPGERLTTHDGYRSEFVLLLTGSVLLMRADRLVALLGPGDSFGELAHLSEQGVDYRAIAESPCEALLLGPREFGGLLASTPSFGRSLAKSLARRLASAEMML